MEDTGPTFWMQMECVNSDRNRCTHQVEAKKQLYLELVFGNQFKPDQNHKRQALRADEKKFVCPNIKSLIASTGRMVGLCDRAYRCTSQSAGASMEPVDTNKPYDDETCPSMSTPYMEAALMTYRPRKPSENFSQMADNPEEDVFADPNFVIDFQQFCNDLLGYQLPHGAYGLPGDALRLRREAVQLFRKVYALNNELFAEFRAEKIFGTPGVVYSATDAAEKIGSYISLATPEKKARLMQRVEARRLALNSAYSTLGLFQTRCNKNIADRRQRGENYLCDLSDDLIAPVARYLDTMKDVSALLQTCKSFSTREELLQRKPNLRIRPVVGCFPHFRQPSRDRKDVENGVDKAVMRGFVTSRQPVRIYIDFGMMERRKVLLKKKERKDGLSHLERDLEDDEYEDPPESKSRRQPKRMTNPHSPIPPGMQIPVELNHHARFEASQERRLKRWDMLDGPEERVDRYHYMKRIPYSTYFDKPLDLTIHLVYADTQEEVVNARYPQGLQPSNQLSRDGMMFVSTGDEAELTGNQHPAPAKFHVPHLSAYHQNRLFKLRITGTGKYNAARGGGDARIVIYSESFEVNSRKSVVDNASKRAAAEEAKHAKKVKKG